MIDSHCHLGGEEFRGDLASVVQRSKEAGLERALIILEAGNEGEASQAAQVEALWPEVRVAIGVHPHTASAYAADPLRAAKVVREQIGRTPMARAVGEMGLDYHYDFSPRVVQQRVFRSQLALARDLGLPVVVHTREADADTLAILGEGGVPPRGVLHCFTGSADLARAALDLGLYISLAGVVTFPRATDLRDVVRLVPLDRMLVETDSPFLSPVPHRGARNEPANVVRVIEVIARVHQVEATDVVRQTTANFHALFRP